MAGCNASPRLEVQERILDKMSVAVEGFVEGTPLLTVLTGRDLSLHPLTRCLRDDGVAAVAFVLKALGL